MTSNLATRLARLERVLLPTQAESPRAAGERLLAIAGRRRLDRREGRHLPPAHYTDDPLIVATIEAADGRLSAWREAQSARRETADMEPS